MILLFSDVDECDNDADNICEDICVNTDPTDSATAPRYYCTCHDGYELDTSQDIEIDYVCNGM